MGAAFQFDIVKTFFCSALYFSILWSNRQVRSPRPLEVFVHGFNQRGSPWLKARLKVTLAEIVLPTATAHLEIDQTEREREPFYLWAV